jgi:hypothetical protein
MVADTRWRYEYVVRVTNSSFLNEIDGRLSSGNYIFTRQVTKHRDQYCFDLNTITATGVDLSTETPLESAASACSKPPLGLPCFRSK